MPVKSISVADVGDGLCIAIYTLFGESILIDCGSREGSQVALDGLRRILYPFHGIDVLVLSHFHIDHYNGLLRASNELDNYIPPIIPQIRQVYYPRIPEFKEKEEFIADLFVMNLIIFGDETGIMEYDFLKAISKINRGQPFIHKALSKGDLINVNSSIFEVLWPPQVIGKGTIRVIKQAIEDFHNAMEQDIEIRRLYERVQNEGVFREYIKEETDKKEAEPNRDVDLHRETVEKRGLPVSVKKANDSLKKAANDLSLVICEDNRLLLLGDTQNREIKQIVGYLKKKNRSKFHTLVTPHHGTCWNNSLNDIRCIYSVTSNGSSLYCKMKPYFKSISQRSFATYINGDVVIPIYLEENRRYRQWND